VTVRREPPPGPAGYVHTTRATGGPLEGGGFIVGSLISMVITVVVSVGVMVGLFTAANLLVNRLPQRWDDRIRPWVFVGPAVVFLFIGLVVPAIRTVYLSFMGGDHGERGFTLDNYWGSSDHPGVLRDKSVFGFTNFSHIFTSRLFWFAILLAAVAVLAAWRSARKEAGVGGEGKGLQLNLTNPLASIAIVLSVIVVLLAVFSTLRGVLWNNLWWVVAVTGLATLFGLGLAVLADRSRNETAAKTLIFMPMAISMVGAAVIWSYMYNFPSAGQSPGLLNALHLGKLMGADPVDFLRSPRILPWNNFFIMMIMIWIQVGFAMVVFSAAIKGVPDELIEAAKVDGANDVQVFWRITLPQIIPTVIVVTTTLIVTVMKVFDLVKATTNGNFETDVMANRMYDNLRNGNFTMSSTFAVLIFVLILPVMWFNFRRGKEAAK
jgi:ABC-type sugar transport system permease subunit